MDGPGSPAAPSRASSQIERRLQRISTAGTQNRASVHSSAYTEDPGSGTVSITDDATKNHRRLVFADPVAFSYLADDHSTTVLARRRPLEGYEAYVVEQWACSRSHPTFVITTFTGDPAHKVITNVLGVPADEQQWSPQLAMYDKALRQYHAREKTTPLGTIMVTNLSGFPSSLNVIPIPDGDIFTHKELFVVAENLKRLGCSGRAGLKLTEPNGATQAKFQQLYRTSEKIAFKASVIELVKLCQVALFLFGKLRADYADGLLCDVTEQAINDWWIEFGTEFYNVEPHDGILGPTTVAALLGMLMGARNRLHAYGAPVAKDVFDLEATKRGIAYFQRSQRIDKTRRFDHHTLDRLRRSTAKAASGEGWTMPRAVKSTVAELSGKGGEMVMDMVGVRDKAGIADIETADIEIFVESVHGEKGKWLWYGKPRKSTTNDMFGRLPSDEGPASQRDEQGNLTRASKRKDPLPDDFTMQKRDMTASESLSRATTFNDEDKEQSSKRNVLFQKASERMTDARSGLGKIKDAVGRRGHQSRASRDERSLKMEDKGSSGQSGLSGQSVVKDASSQDTSLHSTPHSVRREASYEPTFAKVLSHTPPRSQTPLVSSKEGFQQPQQGVELKTALKPNRDYDSKPPVQEHPFRNDAIQDGGFDEHLLADVDPQYGIGSTLRRTQSGLHIRSDSAGVRHDGWWPRHMSFSLAEDSVLTWTPLDDDPGPASVTNPKQEMSAEILKAADARRMRTQLRYLEVDLGRRIDMRISEVQQLDETASKDGMQLEEMYDPLENEYHTLRQDTQILLGQERSQLKEAATDIEQMADQLEYEIDQLKSKLEDVEDSVGEFERQVRDVEGRVRELDGLTVKEGVLHWLFRRMTGLGTAPSGLASP